MHLLEISPFLWRISDSFGVRWNGLSLMLSILISFVFVSWLVFRQRSELAQKMVGDFIILATLGALIGARLGYSIFFAPELFIQFRPEFPFWGILAVDEGGMSSMGGVIGGFVVCTLYAIRTGISRLYLYDLMAMSAPIGFFLGRIANFLSGELLGRPVSDPIAGVSVESVASSIPFAMKFPTEIYEWPKASFEKLSELTPVVQKVGVDADKWKGWLAQYSADPTAQISVNESLAKIVDAVQSGQAEVIRLLEPLLVIRHPVQLYGALIEGVFLFMFLFLLWYKPRRPGVIAATFLILFSALHMAIDPFRMHDPQFLSGFLGLSRDQWLCVGGIIAGFVCRFMWNRKETLPASGWGRGQNVKLHRR
jgi:phosphatidylglycerol:prolipoprotein diacylglycerol transferase